METRDDNIRDKMACERSVRDTKMIISSFLNFQGTIQTASRMHMKYLGRRARSLFKRFLRENVLSS